MVNNQTVFVLGAGASNEVGLPTGAELKRQIGELLDIRFERGHQMLSGDVLIYEALRSVRPLCFRRLTFIVFNYDRCLEHYLFHAFQNFYQVGREVAADLVKGIRIFHPYRAAGFLPWQQSDGAVGFGSTVAARQLLSLSSEIKTINR